MQGAAHLVIISYCLSEADYLIRAMLARSFARRSEEVFVVTMSRSGFGQYLIEQRYRHVFAQCRFEADGFAGFVD